MKIGRREAELGRKPAGREALEDPKTPRTPPKPENCNFVALLARKPLLSVVNASLSTTTADLAPESVLPPHSPLRNL